jgi:hypothetical protein
MAAQGITAIQFVDYDSTILNGHPDSAFVAAFGFHIDTNHIKIDQHYLGTPGWNVTVYDLQRDTAWNWYGGHLTYPHLPNLRLAYEGYVQGMLGSWLQGQVQFVGMENIQGRLCNIFTDSTGYREWVWTDHAIPIQRRRESRYNNLHQITYTQKRQVSINLTFPDSVFLPPG